MSKSICAVHQLGVIDYQIAWDLQNQFAAEIAFNKRPATLLFLEHPHTFTFGRQGNAANLLWDEAALTQKGITVHWVDRGGDITYHGPGQLVGYPLIPLGRLKSAGESSHLKTDYVGFIRKLEKVIIAAVAEFGVFAKQVKGLTGVWIDQEPGKIAKLAAIGIKVDANGITRHGFALNVNPDMRYWEGIIGCGLPYPEISLAQLLNPVPTMTEVMTVIIQAFCQIFDYKIVSLKKK